MHFYNYQDWRDRLGQKLTLDGPFDARIRESLWKLMN